MSDDGVGGVGRNAIIMGAIGVPTFDVEGHDHDHHGHGPPVRRSGAQLRLMGKDYTYLKSKQLKFNVLMLY